MSRIKQMIEDWADEVCQDLDKFVADFEKHADFIDRKMGLK